MTTYAPTRRESPPEQVVQARATHTERTFDKSLLQHLYESGPPWSEIEAALPGQNRRNLESRCRQAGWRSPSVRRASSKRPSQTQTSTAATVTWTLSAKRFFLLLIHGDELVCERWAEYPRDILIEWAFAEVRGSRTVHRGEEP